MDYMWSKGQGSTLSGKGSKFGSKCGHRREKRKKFASGSFLFFFFLLDKCQLDLFVSTSSFSLVTLTLALSARPLAYAFPLSPSPLPRLHMHKPTSTALVLASLSDVFPFLPILSQDAHAREALPCARTVLGSVWQGSHSCPLGCLTTTLSVLTSLSLFLGVLST